MKERERLTPGEVIAQFPDFADKLDWTAADIGNLVQMKILDGRFSPSSGKSQIRIESIIALAEFLNQRADRQKIDYGKQLSLPI